VRRYRRVFIRERHQEPTFNGRHNAVKAKAWLALLDNKLSGKDGLTVSELADMTGANVASLSVLLCRWRYWNYVSGWGKRGQTRYVIMPRGQRWLDRWISRGVLPLQRYLDELGSCEAEQ